MSKIGIIRIFVIISLCVFSVSPAFAQSPSIDTGYSWLITNQTAQGNWPGVMATSFYSSASSLDALAMMNPTAEPFLKGIQWINQQAVVTTDYLSHKIIVSKKAGIDASAEIAALLLYRNQDGGWGIRQGYQSENFDTAFALEALKAANYSDPSIVNAALAYLAGSQNADGGWGFYSSDISNMYMTAVASSTLQHFPQTAVLAASVNKATSYLLAHQNTDGGFGSSPSTVYETALAYRALSGVITDATILAGAVNHLIAAQSSDGSWLQDPYSTALALQALHIAETRPSTPPPAPTTGSVNGRVVDGSTNQPLSGVSVVLASDASIVALTDGTGSFSLTNIPQGSQQIAFSLSGYATSTATVTIAGGSITNLGSITLSAVSNTGIIQGIVTDASSGSPLSGVAIEITGSTTWTAVTAANGTYKITGITPGTVVLSAGKSGFSRISGSGTVTAGGTLIFSPALSTAPPTATTGGLKGAVTDSASGLPIAGATISVNGAGNYTASTDVSGNFSLSAMDAGSYTVSISAAGYGTQTYTVTIIAGTTTNVGTIALVLNATTGMVQGKVTDAESGAPIAGATVTVVGSTTWTAITIADGSYKITGIAPGTITISASMTGYYTASGSTGITAGGTVVFSPALSTSPPVETTGVLKGTVADKDGQSLSGAAVSLVGTKTYTASTGPAGDFTVSTVDPGSYVVAISAAGYLSQSYSVTILAGVTTDIGTIHLLPSPTTGSVSGMVTDASTGSVMAGVTITVTGTSTWQAITGSDGTYQISDVTPGEVAVSAGKTGYGTVSGSGMVMAGGILTFSPGLPALPTTGAAKGVVADAATGAPLQGVTVTMIPISPGGDLHAVSGAAGDFTITAVNPGSFTVTFAASGYAGQTYSLSIMAGVMTDIGSVNLMPMPQSTTIAGKVTDAATGAPLANADVVIAETTVGTKTDSDGNYTISGIALSDFLLRASREGYDSLPFHASLNSYGTYQVNFPLTASQASALTIVSFSTDQQNYAAYAPVSVAVSVQNGGSALIAGMVNITIENVQGDVVDYFLATHVDANGAPQNSYDFPPGAATLIRVPWDTKDLPPGTYAIIARVITVNAGVGGGTSVAVESASSFRIDPTQAIASLALTPLPRFTNLGTTEQVSLMAALANRSNIATELVVAYEWRSPSGAVLKTGTSTISLVPAESSKSIQLDTFPFTFTESGEHSLSVSTESGPIPASLNGGVVSTAPGIRIEPSQNVSPATVVPDGDKRIRINIHLKGVEVKQ